MSNGAVKSSSRHKRLLFWALILLPGLWPALTACSSVAPVVKIGLVAPFEGRHRPVGYDVIYSARLAIREVNNAGGIGDYRVALVALDDYGDPLTANQTAAALVVDPDVVAVIGNWLPKTTAAAEMVYKDGGLSYIPTGQPPFGIIEPATLPASFQEAYAGVTPFDEEAGPYAGTAYDAVNLLLAAMADAESVYGVIDRKSMEMVLKNYSYNGLTGTVTVSHE